ncbi:hypothetical protein ACOMHN_039275 [Nucella lapillus]
MMSTSDHQNMQRLGHKSGQGNTDRDGGQGIGGKSVSRWIADLNSKLGELEDQDSDIENLKSSIIDIRDELKLLRRSRVSDAHRSRESKEAQHQANTQMIRKMVGMKVDGEKFKSAVHALSNMQRLLAKDISGLKKEQKDVLMKVSELEKSSTDLTTVVSSLKATDIAVQEELEEVKDGTNALTSAFNKLQAKLNRELANKQLPPGMVKLKHNQGTLATALESVMDKVSSLMGQLPFLEKQLLNTNQKVSDQTLHEHSLTSKLKMLFKDLIEVKRSVHNILDPRSNVNMEKAKSMLKLKSDVSMLSEMDKGLKNDLLNQRDDLARLIKDVARLEVLAQHLRDKLTLVLSASRRFHQDIANIKQKQKEALSVVEVAQMQKQVLKALNRLKTREAILLKQLSLYRGAVKKLAGQVEKSVDIKDHTQETVVTLESRLTRFQKEIQLLFDKTKTLTQKMQKPQSPHDMAKLIRSQSNTATQVMDLAQQLRNVRNRISLLSVELRQTKWEMEQEKKEMANDMIIREEEMKKKKEDLTKKQKKEKLEEARAIAIRKKQLEKERNLDKQHFAHQLELEKRKRKEEEKKSQRLEGQLEKRWKQLEREEAGKLQSDLEKKKKQLEKEENALLSHTGANPKRKVHVQVQKKTGGEGKQAGKTKSVTQKFKIHKKKPLGAHASTASKLKHMRGRGLGRP